MDMIDGVFLIMRLNFYWLVQEGKTIDCFLIKIYKFHHQQISQPAQQDTTAIPPPVGLLLVYHTFQQNKRPYPG